MGVTDSDWQLLIKHLKATLSGFQVPQQEQDDVPAFIDTTKADIVGV
jgi:hypothetical protein